MIKLVCSITFAIVALVAGAAIAGSVLFHAGPLSADWFTVGTLAVIGLYLVSRDK